MATEAMFGHYRLLELLGQGGMGEVWRAHDTRKDREVALKVLGAWLGADPSYAHRFRNEAARAARLNTPNIIPIHDYGEIDGRLFIDMPLIDGHDLDTLLAREGPLPLPRAVGIIDQVADALDAAHEAGLVHRDVKPSNVLITTRRSRDYVYLIDFGICAADGAITISPTGALIGTPTYMAPERFAGEGDRRSDVYALACVLHATLTGQPPFNVPTGAYPLGFYLNAHQNEPPPRPSELTPGVPAGFDAVIARGMAKHPRDRYPTAGDLATAAHTALCAAAKAAGRAQGEAKPGTGSATTASGVGQVSETNTASDTSSAVLRSAGPETAPPLRQQHKASQLDGAHRPGREQQRAAARARREGVMRGDQRYLRPRDHGPVRAYIRDVVDSRPHFLGLFMPLAVVVVISVVLPLPTAQSYLSLFSLICLLTMIVDGLVLGLSTTRKVRAKFPHANVHLASLGWYAFTRASQIRKLRVPKPRVERGAEP